MAVASNNHGAGDLDCLESFNQKFDSVESFGRVERHSTYFDCLTALIGTLMGRSVHVLSAEPVVNE